MEEREQLGVLRPVNHYGYIRAMEEEKEDEEKEEEEEKEGGGG